MMHCETCGHTRHSLLRYAKGWLCYRLFLAMPHWLFRPASSALLPSAGDYVFDQRGYCDANHRATPSTPPGR